MHAWLQRERERASEREREIVWVGVWANHDGLARALVDDALKLGADQRIPPAAHAACRESFRRVKEEV